MIDDFALILTSVAAASGTVALLRRRGRRGQRTRPGAVHEPRVSRGAGARHLADALCAAAAEPLRIAGPHWKSLAETLQLPASDRLERSTARHPR